LKIYPEKEIKLSRARTAIVGMLSTAALLFSVDPSRSTSIIAVVTSTDIVLGADSKAVIATAENAPFSDMCKIVSGPNNVFVAFSGLAREIKRRFIMADVVRHAMSNGANIETRIAALNDALVPKLAQIADDLRINNRPYFHDHVDGKIVTSVVLVGFENSVSHLDVIDYRIQSEHIPASIEIVKRDCPPTGCVGNNDALRGDHEAIDRILAANPNIWTQPGLVNTVRTLIAAEAAAQPQFVGGPIAILKVTKDGGPNWISYGACAAASNRRPMR
jgi:hypothetical protein